MPLKFNPFTGTLDKVNKIIWLSDGTYTYPSNITDDIVFGGTDKWAPFYYKVSKGSLKLRSISGSGASSLVIFANNITGVAAFNVQNLPLSVNMETGKAFQFMVIGEIKARGMFYSDGSYFMGDGTNMRDVGFMRGGTKTLKIASDKSGGAADLEVTGNVNVGDVLTVSGQSIISSGLVVNEDGGATSADDFRVETDTMSNALFIDASDDEVQVNASFKINDLLTITPSRDRKSVV